jgi:hypothetical protein
MGNTKSLDFSGPLFHTVEFPEKSENSFVFKLYS